MQPKNAIFGAFCLLLTACATQPPALDTSAGAKQTFDGLYPVDNVRVDMAWARQDLELSGYNKIIVQGAGIHYRPVKASAGSRSAVRRGETEFPLTEAQKDRIREVFAAAFREELEKLENLEIVDEPGPDVLLVRGALLDVVSRVPPEPIGRVDIYLDSIGQATLVIELIDSQSETVLVRAVDVRAAEQQGIAFASSPVTNRAEVRRLARSWAQLLRRRLEELSTTLLIGTRPVNR